VHRAGKSAAYTVLLRRSLSECLNIVAVCAEKLQVVPAADNLGAGVLHLDVSVLGQKNQSAVGCFYRCRASRFAEKLA
jgi:hypothetical protein